MVDDIEADALTALVAGLPAEKQVDFVLDVLEKVQDERDSLRAALADAMAAGQSMEGQCNDLEDERDRLRAVVDADPVLVARLADLDAQAIAELRARAEVAEADRDRLRAVVDAAQSLVAALDIGVVRDELVDLRARLDQLDVSPTMGGEE